MSQPDALRARELLDALDRLTKALAPFNGAWADLTARENGFFTWRNDGLIPHTTPPLLLGHLRELMIAQRAITEARAALLVGADAPLLAGAPDAPPDEVMKQTQILCATLDIVRHPEQNLVYVHGAALAAHALEDLRLMLRERAAASAGAHRRDMLQVQLEAHEKRT